MEIINKFVLGIVLIRVFSGSLEIIVALIMLRLNQLDKALIINTSFALVGPFVLLFTTSIGLVGISDKISYAKIVWVFLGVLFIIIGIRK